MPHARGALSAKRKRVLKPSLVLVSTVSCRLEKLFYIISLPPPKLVTMLSIVKKNCLRVAHQNFEASYKDIKAAARLLWKIKKAYSLGIPKKQTGSRNESDRGGTRLWGKVYNLSAKWKVF